MKKYTIKQIGRIGSAVVIQGESVEDAVTQHQGSIIRNSKLGEIAGYQITTQNIYQETQTWRMEISYKTAHYVNDDLNQIPMSVTFEIADITGHTEISQAAAAMGRVKSAAKAKASRANGAKGGRPKFHWHPAPARGTKNPAAEFYRYTVVRLADGAERFTDSRPRVRSDKYLAWDNQENCEV